MSARASRRGILAGFAFPTVAAAPALAAAGPHPDAALLGLCAETAAAWAALMALDDPTHPQFLEDDVADAASDAFHALWDRVNDTPARTLEGHRAKAGVALRAFDYMHAGSPLDSYERGTRAVLADLAGGTA